MSKNIESQTEQQEEEHSVDLPALSFFGINIITFVVPLYPCMGLFLFYFYMMNLWAIDLLWIIVFFPSVFILLLYIYILLLIEFCAIFTRRWHKKSPPEQGIFKRGFLDHQVADIYRTKYYHLRGFIIKYPVWISSKSPFPWLVNRTLRRISHSKIGKNVIMEDVFVGLEFTDIKDNVYLYPSVAISSHSVNSIFGKLNVFEIGLYKNSVIYPGNITGPGGQVGKDFVVLPNTVIHKHWTGKENELFYQGSPGRPTKYKGIDKEKIDN